MNVSTQKLPNCELVTISGVLDSSSAPALEKTLLGLLGSGKNRIVINLAQVEFLSSVGLKALLAAVLQARRQSPPGDVVIAGASQAVTDIFQRVGLMHVFKFYPDDEQAAASLG